MAELCWLRFKSNQKTQNTLFNLALDKALTNVKTTNGSENNPAVEKNGQESEGYI